MTASRALALAPRDRTEWLVVTTGVVLGWVLVLLVVQMGALAAFSLVVAGLAAAILMLAFPFAGVLLGVFVLYTNLPAQAVDRGVIPDQAAALVGILFLPAVLRHLVARREDIRLDRTFALMGALLGVMLVSAFFTVDVPRALAYIGGYTMEGIAVFLLVLNTVRDRKALTRVLVVVVGAAALLAVLSIYQAVTGNFHHEFFGLAQRTTEGLEYRSRGPTDDANRYAQILLIAGSFALALFWTARGRLRAFAMVAAGLIAGGILLTYSRGAFLALVPLLLFLALARVISLRRLALVVLAGVVLVPAVVPGYVERIHSIAGAMRLVSADATTVEPDGATRGRTTQMLAALLAYSEHPVLGVGPGVYVPHYSVQYQLRPEIAFREIPTPRRAHNLFLEFAAETGTVGLAFFLAIPGFLLRDLWRIRRRAEARRGGMDRLALGFMLAILSYLATGMFLHLAFQRYYWLLIGLSAAAVWIMREQLGRAEWNEQAAPEGGIGAPEVVAPLDTDHQPGGPAPAVARR